MSSYKGYLFPYEYCSKWGGRYIRKNIDPMLAGFCVYIKRYDKYQREIDPTPQNIWVHAYNSRISPKLISFSSFEEAKFDLDKHLIKDNYYLIKDYEVIRFKEKLRLLL